MAFSDGVGTDWAGEYSRWIFDESKAYMLVAKMMREPGTLNGIPLLDAELNEQGEIMLQLMRRLIKRIYGNGSTNNGFKIAQSASSPNNNFTIKGGDGTLAGAGYLFVEGWMPFNQSDVEYEAQSYGPTALTTPSGSARTDVVYIDVYYKEVDSVDDSEIKDGTIGMETSRRIALVWEVKVAQGGSVPANYVDANNVQHWTMKLATIARLDADASITTAMITDNRNDARLVSLASELTAHGALTNPHGATSAATAARLILRDAGGRAQVGAPSAENDIARKAEVTTHANLTSPHSATSAATADRIILRDASGRAKVAAPVESDDIARKADVEANELPAGMIIMVPTETVPSGFLHCNGAYISKATYANLYSAIGSAYGDDGVTFRLPNYKGYFLRGWNNGSGVDPDAASRTNRGDGTTGDHVGTKQADEFKSHTHSAPGTNTHDEMSGHSGFAGDGNGVLDYTDSTGGNETRPANISVMYCIKY